MTLTGNDQPYVRLLQSKSLAEIAERLRQLVDTGLVAIAGDENGNPWNDRNDLSYVWRGWFGMTPQGKEIWQSLQHPLEPMRLK